jgi:UDPglucose 6-dehydrogenase
VRDSTALLIADRLRLFGATVTVYDPMGSGNALACHPEFGYAGSAVAAAANADVIAVLTAWPEFGHVDPAEIAGVARGPPWWTHARGLTPQPGAVRVGGCPRLPAWPAARS